MAFIGGLLVGIACLWFAFVDHQEALMTQVISASDVSRSLQEKKVSADRYVEQLQKEDLDVQSIDDEKDATIIVLRPRLNFLGIGGRWVIVLNKNNKDEISSSTFEFQAMGYP